MRNKVSDLQSKLSHAVKQSLDRKFGALYDKIYREDVVLEAWKLVKANKGAPGVDKQDFEYIKDVIGVDQFLAQVREQLKSERYRPQPVLRCYIEKPGKPEKRPLGIPIIFDRVCQMATKLVIEPIFETNFLDCSHGFRPGRSAHDAIRIIGRTITFKGQRIVLDADIVGFFDNIRQDILLKLVERRIADDFVILLWRNGKVVRKQVEQMLGRLGLKLHPDKTRVVKAKDGFDFLGVHFRLCPVRNKKSKLKKYCAVWPSDSSVAKVKQRIRKVIGRRYSLSLEELIKELTPIIRGWNNYHKASRPVLKRMRKLNAFVRERIRIFLKRKYSDQSRGTWRVHNNLVVRLGLYQFG